MKTSNPHNIISDGLQYTTPKSTASICNAYIVSIGKTLADKITSSKIFTETVVDLPETSFQLKELDESTVLQQLLSLKANKAIGLDIIDTRLSKCAAHSICPSITKLLICQFDQILFLRYGNVEKYQLCLNQDTGLISKTTDQFPYYPRSVKSWKELSIVSYMNTLT
mgnify:FL=1